MYSNTCLKSRETVPLKGQSARFVAAKLYNISQYVLSCIALKGPGKVGFDAKYRKTISRDTVSWPYTCTQVNIMPPDQL